MKKRHYIVRSESESVSAATFDEALRIAQRWREKTCLPIDIFDPENRIVAAFAAVAPPANLDVEYN